ncbi:Ig-like domain-containing protein [Desulfobacterales bacterium HSG17]|nr:Ig-like domain-containing protein [Desulfobacterales bacterium HSG17]
MKCRVYVLMMLLICLSFLCLTSAHADVEYNSYNGSQCECKGTSDADNDGYGYYHDLKWEIDIDTFLSYGYDFFDFFDYAVLSEVCKKQCNEKIIGGDSIDKDEADCDDTNGEVHPEAIETCGDGVDADCNGVDTVCLPSIVSVTPDVIVAKAGDTVTITVKFSKAVYIVSDGVAFNNISSSFNLDNGGIASFATVKPGYIETDTLVYTYAVKESDEDTDKLGTSGSITGIRVVPKSFIRPDLVLVETDPSSIGSPDYYLPDPIDTSWPEKEENRLEASSVRIDSTPPTVTLSCEKPFSNTTPFKLTAKFSEKIDADSLSPDDFVSEYGISNLKPASSSGDEWSFDVTPSESGEWKISLPAGSFKDIVGFANKESAEITLTLDKTKPSVEITTEALNPVSASPFTVTAKFSEPVENFSDISVSVTNGSASGLTGSKDTYTFTVTPEKTGALEIYIPAEKAKDKAGNLNTASNTITRTVDATPPTVILSTDASNPTNTKPFIVTATFSEKVTAFAAGKISVSNGSAGNLTGSGTTYTFEVTPLADSEVSVTIPADAALDKVSNKSKASNTISLTYDGTAPKINSLKSDKEFINTGPFTITAIFSEKVKIFTADKITISNGTVDSISGSGTTYIITVKPSAEGKVTISIPENITTDNVGNKSTGTASVSVTYDTTAPTLTLTSAPANSKPVKVTATFSEPVTGFTIDDLILINGTASNFEGTGSSYTFDLTPEKEGKVTINVSANAATDKAGNKSLASSASLTYDSTAPTCSLSCSEKDPTKNKPFKVKAAFNESVTDFTIDDVNVTNGTASNLTVSETEYTFDITPAADGKITINIPADAASDKAGNKSKAAEELSLTYDGTAPTVKLATSTSDPTGIKTFSVTATFSEEVTGLLLSEIIVTNGTVISFTGSGKIYSFEVTPLADGIITINIPANAAADKAGNNNTASDTISLTCDGTAPTIVLTTGASNLTNTKPFSVTATFSEEVTDFALNDINADNGFAGNFSGSGTTYVFDVTPTADGSVKINIPENAALDKAGNKSKASNDISILYDGTPPKITSFGRQTPASQKTNADTLVFRVTFSENIKNADSADFSINSTSTAGITAVSAVTAAVYDVTISGGDLASFNNSVGLNLAAAANITDDVGNALAAGEPALDETYIVDNTLPDVTINQAAEQADPTNNNTIYFTAVFSEDVTGFTGTGVALSGTAGASSKVVTGSGTTYNIAVSGMTTSGNVLALIPPGMAQDLAGNLNNFSTFTDNSVDYNNAGSISGNYIFDPATDEDTTLTGVKVSTILADPSIVVVDTDAGTSGIAVTAMTGNEKWQFSPDSTDGEDGVWTDFDQTSTPSNTASLLLDENTWIRYVPDNIKGENPVLTFRFWDQTTGTASVSGTASYADTSVNGGATAYSSGTAKASLTVSSVNDIPILTAFTDVIGTTNEDEEIEITFAKLAAQGNEADVDGTVTAFVVKSIKSGSLKIGESSSTATAFDASTNNTIDSSNNAYWTPDENDYGKKDALELTAKDNNDGVSASGVIAQISVTPVNDIPTLTVFTAPVDSMEEDNTVEITFEDLTAQGDEDDVDGTITAFVVTSVSSGSLKIGTDVSTATAFDASSNKIIDSTKNAFWTPDENTNGITGAFELLVKDDIGAVSAIVKVIAQVSITAVNDIPTLTAFSAPVAATDEDTEVEITLTALEARGDEADVDGTVKGFVVKLVKSGSLKIGENVGSAKVFDVLSNNTIDAANKGYWIPAENENGILNALEVLAKDDGGSVSETTGVLAQISVTDINDIPILTAFAAPVKTTAEDTPVDISFADLANQGDEADVDGSVTAFFVKTVSSGSLKIGADSDTAIPFDAAANNTIDAANKGYWTPAENANGDINVLEVTAQDDLGAESAATGVIAQISVTDINDLPTLTAFAAPVDTINEDTEVEISFEDLAAQGDEADVDGTVTAFIVRNVSSGSLKIGTDAAAAGVFDESANKIIDSTNKGFWIPAENANGILNAFEVHVKDDKGGLSLTAGVIAQVSVTPVNNIPTLTLFEASINTTNSDTEVEISFEDLAAKGNEADIDGSITGFVIKVVKSGSLKIGTDAATAAAFDAAANNTIDAAKKGYWTPGETIGKTDVLEVLAKDNSGGVSETTGVIAQFYVADENAPKLTCPEDMSIPAAGPLTPVTYEAVLADNTDTGVVISYDKPSGSDFTPGTTPVTVTAADASGNSSKCTFMVMVHEYDFGDAYGLNLPTFLANDGARHAMDGITFLGAGVDSEVDAQIDIEADTEALGDDNDGNDDDDGVSFTSASVQNTEASIEITASVTGFINAWIDFNSDGDWEDEGEHVFADETLVPGVNSLSFMVPENAVPGKTLSRFRFSTVQGLSYNGAAENGEVEDYEVSIVSSVVTYALSAAKTGTGTGIVSSSPKGINCGEDCVQYYDQDTQITLTASAEPGSEFTGWSGPCTGTGECIVTINETQKLTAAFEISSVPQYTLTVKKDGNGIGTVSSEPAGIKCGDDCTQDYNKGTQVTLTAASGLYSEFAGWSGACSGTGECIVAMEQIQDVIAVFNTTIVPQYTLNIYKNGNGSGKISSASGGIDCGVDCNRDYNLGTQVTLTVLDEPDSEFTGWVGAGCTGTGECVVTMNSSQNIIATFEVSALIIPDTENDGMSDEWETENGLNPDDASDASADNDNDGLNNLEEFIYKTEPDNGDSDNDGINDGDEVAAGIDPTDDTDSDPNNAKDADNDGMPDFWEKLFGLDPAYSFDDELDADNDGLTNLEEFILKSNPNDPDTDNDGMPDGWEYDYGLDIFDPSDAGIDTDNDGLSSIGEYMASTNPANPDTDGDGLPDGWEYDFGLNPLDASDALLDKDNDNLSNTVEYSYATNPAVKDTDGDGMPDDWENNNGLNPNNPSDAQTDPDEDGLVNLNEFLSSADPNRPDTDMDGMPDGWEYDNSLNPTDSSDKEEDPDNDGIINIYEYFFDTDPNNPDTDGDGMPDRWEKIFELDPNDPSDAQADADEDGLTNLEEYQIGTSPNRADTDRDGMPDGWEYNNSLNPKDPSDKDQDPDNDGLTNLEEYKVDTDPHVANTNEDTDGDGIPNIWEKKNGLDPTDPSDAQDDPDNDGLSNLDEYKNGTDPNVADTDGDGVNDGDEINAGTDPLVPNTVIPEEPAVTEDNDGMPGWWEDQHGLNKYSPSDADQDPDNDGLTNLEEYKNGTDPNVPDTDGDGVNDGDEINAGTDPLVPNTVIPEEPAVTEDNDGIPGAWEDQHGLDKYSSSDADGDPDNDGLSNLEEYKNGTDPNNPDTDGDGFSDADEVSAGTDPLNPHEYPTFLDSDNDGRSDIVEYAENTDPYIPDTYEITHMFKDDGYTRGEGFILQFVSQKASGLIMAIETPEGEDIIESERYTGTGTSEDPVIFTWTPESKYTKFYEDTPLPGDKSYEVSFRFYADTSTLPFVYTVKYTSYAGSENNLLDTPQDQEEFEKLYEAELPIVNHMERVFDPSSSPEFNYFVRDWTGQYRHVLIKIPVIDYKYLFVNDPDGINLGYSPAADTFNINPENNIMKLVSGDLLRLKIDTYNFGEDTVAEAMTIKFEAATGQYKGFPVCYNPKQVRSQDAPGIKFSIKLNRDAPASEVLNSITDAPRLMSFMINETGDGSTGFVNADTPFEVNEDGLAAVEINHLTSIGFIVEDADRDKMPDDWENKNNLDMNDPADALKDADNDGMTNLEEFTANTDPHVNLFPPEPESPEPELPEPESPAQESESDGIGGWGRVCFISASQPAAIPLAIRILGSIIAGLAVIRRFRP